MRGKTEKCNLCSIHRLLFMLYKAVSSPHLTARGLSENKENLSMLIHLKLSFLDFRKKLELTEYTIFENYRNLRLVRKTLFEG